MRTRSASAALLAVALLAAAAGCRRPGEPPLQAPEGSATTERVRVLNADVLVIDGRHVRLAAVAAPQPIPQARCWAEALAAKQATVELRNLIRVAGDLRLEPTGETDESGRVVARVIVDNQDLGQTLHDMGLVAEADARRFSWCEPISKGEAGAPELKSLMDFGR